MVSGARGRCSGMVKCCGQVTMELSCRLRLPYLDNNEASDVPIIMGSHPHLQHVPLHSAPALPSFLECSRSLTENGRCPQSSVYKGGIDQSHHPIEPPWRSCPCCSDPKQSNGK